MSPFTRPARTVAGDTLVAVLIGVVSLWAVLHASCIETKAFPWAGMTLVLGWPSAAVALGVTWPALVSLLIPVLDGGALLVSHAAAMSVHLQALWAGCAGPRR